MADIDPYGECHGAGALESFAWDASTERRWVRLQDGSPVFGPMGRPCHQSQSPVLGVGSQESDLKEAAGVCGGRGELWGLNRFTLPGGWHLATVGLEKLQEIDIQGDGHVTGGGWRMEFLLLGK